MANITSSFMCTQELEAQVVLVALVELEVQEVLAALVEQEALEVNVN